MLHELLKLVTYLSILTLSTSSSSHLSRESYSNNQRASPYSFPSDDVYAPSLYDNNNNNGEDVGWVGYENSMDNAAATAAYNRKSSPSSSSDYLITSYINAGATSNHPSSNRFYIPNSSITNNNKNGGLNNKSAPKRGKKDNSRFNSLKMSRSQQLDEPQRKKSNSKISNKNATENIMQNPNNINKKLNKPQSTSLFSSSQSSASAYSNEYPQSAAISSSKDQELQQLFGVENAQIYRKHQKQPQGDLLHNNKAVEISSGDAVDLKESQKKRSNGDREELLPDMPNSMASHLMPRTTRRQREYDVPLIRKLASYDKCMMILWYVIWHDDDDGNLNF